MSPDRLLLIGRLGYGDSCSNQDPGLGRLGLVLGQVQVQSRAGHNVRYVCVCLCGLGEVSGASIVHNKTKVILFLSLPSYSVRDPLLKVCFFLSPQIMTQSTILCSFNTPHSQTPKL